MAKVKKSLPSVLTPEDKSYLRSYSRYLRSMGMTDGNIEVDGESIGGLDEIDFDEITGLSNNYRVETTPELMQILKKISLFIDEKGLFEQPDIDNLNYERFEFDIDAEKQQILVSYYYTYYDIDEGSSTQWEGDDEDIEEVFKTILDEGIEPSNGILELRYNGSGDSGYIDNSFEPTNDQVPASVEDWCYNQLENQHGGWEINEGSQGVFIFDFKDQTITLNHQYNVEETINNTLFEESFAK